jgi:hypothetical protein
LWDPTENGKRVREGVIHTDHEGPICEEGMNPREKGARESKMSQLMKKFWMTNSIECLCEIIIKDIDIQSSGNGASPFVETFEEPSGDRVSTTEPMLS